MDELASLELTADLRAWLSRLEQRLARDLELRPWSASEMDDFDAALARRVADVVAEQREADAAFFARLTGDPALSAAARELLVGRAFGLLRTQGGVASNNRRGG